MPEDDMVFKNHSHYKIPGVTGHVHVRVKRNHSADSRGVVVVSIVLDEIIFYE